MAQMVDCHDSHSGLTDSNLGSATVIEALVVFLRHVRSLTHYVQFKIIIPVRRLQTMQHKNRNTSQKQYTGYFFLRIAI
jgi:hypothetical protein